MLLSVHEQFLTKRALTESNKPSLFDIFDNPALSPEKREALEFLYAYSPLCDLAEQDGEFFLKNVEASFAAREYFPWGKDIPEYIFRHFVLPIRIYSEQLDTSRTVFFEELKERVSDMSMEDAVREINFWALEKATFQGRNGLPASPLSTCNTAWGNCYELALLGAAALRSVSIPARFCTTVWTTSRIGNHSWVEAWVDGKWMTFSAAEPPLHKEDPTWVDDHCETVIVVASDVFGPYQGPEEILYGDKYATRINLIDNYTETKKITVLVEDKRGRPVQGAHVKLKLFSENSLVTTFEYFTDKAGEMSLTTGKNGYIVEATKNGVSGYSIVGHEMTDITVILNESENISYRNITLDVLEISHFLKLPEGYILPERTAQSETIRRAYMESFAKEEDAYALADSLNHIHELNEMNQINGVNQVGELYKIKVDRREVWRYLKSSNGNWREITQFIVSNYQNPYTFPLLSTISENALKEVSAVCLSDHLNHFTVRDGVPENLIVPYILSPVIGIESVQPWRSLLAPSAKDKTGNGKSGKQLAREVARMVKTAPQSVTTLYTITTPVGVESLKVTDDYSRNIYFIARCRAAGIPARIGPDREPQYYEKGEWHNIAL